MSKTILANALMALVLLGAPFAASADSGHGNKAESAGQGEDHKASEGHGDSATRSATPASAWSALMAARDAIAGDIESGALGDIHEKSEPLPELAAALLEQSKGLDAGKRARVEGAIKQLARVADALHTAADGEDAVRTRKELSRLDGLLKLIRAQYPVGVLDEGAHEMPGHGDHTAAPGTGHGSHAHTQRPKGALVHES